MTDQFESKIGDLIVAKLRNSSAIAIAIAIAMAMARISRLDFAHFDSQPDSPRLVQRLLSNFWTPNKCWKPNPDEASGLFEC